MKDDYKKNDDQNKSTNDSLADAIVTVSNAIENSNKATERSSENIACAIKSSDKKIGNALTAVGDSLHTVAKVIHRDEKSREKEVRMVFWLGLLLPIVTFLGVTITVWSSYKMEANREKLQRNYEEAQLIQVHIDRDNELADRFNRALSALREFKKVQRRDFCKNHTYIASKREYTRKFNEKLFDLIEVVSGMRRNFDKSLYNRVLKITHSLDTEKNICAKDAITDKDLQKEGIEINNLIEKLIHEKEDKIIKLKSTL